MYLQRCLWGWVPLRQCPQPAHSILVQRPPHELGPGPGHPSGMRRAPGKPRAHGLSRVTVHCSHRNNKSGVGIQLPINARGSGLNILSLIINTDSSVCGGSEVSGALSRGLALFRARSNGCGVHGRAWGSSSQALGLSKGISLHAEGSPSPPLDDQ